MKTKWILLGAGVVGGSLVTLVQHDAWASSHREAPLISEDPAVDNTDLWAFTSPDRPNTVTIIAGYYGLEEPGGGPNYQRFSDTARYEIHVDNTGDGVPDITYQFVFNTSYNHPITRGAVGDAMSFNHLGGTVFYNVGQIDGLPTPANFHSAAVAQTMTVTRVDGTGAHVVGNALPTAPTYVGRFAYGTGGQPATTDANYTAIAQQAVQMLSSGESVFAGPRDDPFFVDLGATFDDVSIRVPYGGNGGGIDYLAGMNVHIIALQIPVATLAPSCTTMATPQCVVGVYASASRPRVIVNRGSHRDAHGQFVQVSRLGIPLVNEVLIPLEQKDYWNTTDPWNDVANFGSYLINPSLPGYAAVLYGPGGVRLPTTGVYAVPNPAGRSTTDLTHNDMVTLITGGGGLIPGGGGTLTPVDELRLNVMTASTPLPTNVGRPLPVGSMAYLGAAGGDPNGFPNGRRLFDDVVDIEERYVLNGLANINHIAFGDGVDGNDVPFQATFPYAAIPHPGSEPHGQRTEIAHP